MAQRAAIVTGASSGIGLAIARVLGQEGYAVTMAARRPEKLENAVAELAGEGFEVHGVAANVADEAEIQKVVAAHRERHGRLDVLVNNAGVGIGATLGEIQTKHLDMQLDINLRSIVIFYRECLEMLKAAGAEHRNALVVNTSSISGKRARGLAVGLLGHQARRRRLDRSDEQGARAAGHQVDGALPGVRRYADDRLRQGAGQGRGDDPARRTSPSRCATCCASPPPASCLR